MEALTAVSVALLTVYDMCKAVSKEMVIQVRVITIGILIVAFIVIVNIIFVF